METPLIFQIDDAVVKECYDGDNYLIVTDASQHSNVCAIYFSSHDIYYPNRREVFVERIVRKNFFEWYKQRIPGAKKHIFLRDIHKQWYLSGINSRINTPEKILDFLRRETTGFRIVTIGSSAGGYAAVLYGSLLEAERILTLNGQMELGTQLSSSTELIDPLVFRFKDSVLRKYYSLRLFIKRHECIYHFYSTGSAWDSAQATHVAGLGIKAIEFNTAHHGIPFLKCALRAVLRMESADLDALTSRTQHPLLFSLRAVGAYTCFMYLVEQAIVRLRKRF